MSLKRKELSDKVNSLIDRKKYAEALSYLENEQIVVAEKFLPKIFSLKSNIYKKMKNYDNALREIENAIYLSKEPHFYFQKAMINISIYNYNAVIEDCTNIIEISEVTQFEYYLEMAFFLRAEAYSNMNLCDLALLDLRHVRDDMSTWIGKKITKNCILSKCKSKGSSAWASALDHPA